MCLDFLCGAAISLVQDEREAHARFLVDVQGFGVLDFQKKKPPRLEALKVQRLCSPILMKMIHESQAGRSILR